MSAVTVPSLCDDMLGRVDNRPHHATKVVPASIVRIHCRLHDQDEVGLQLPEELVNAVHRVRTKSQWKTKLRDVALLILVGELLAFGVILLASAAIAAVK
jgi:hypothetical protein